MMEFPHAAESIHQEPVFKASRKRVYQALTEASQFDHVVKMSAAAQSMKSLGDKPAEISREPGGAFTLFGGYITGRQIELIPDQRIVQAWHSGSWGPDDYSIARFELVEQGLRHENRLRSPRLSRRNRATSGRRMERELLGAAGEIPGRMTSRDSWRILGPGSTDYSSEFPYVGTPCCTR